MGNELAIQRLEALVTIEADLKKQYGEQLAQKDTVIAQAIEKQAALQSTIEQQKAQLMALSTASADTKRLEQLNRELNHRADNSREETEAQKQRIKMLQKERGEARATIKALKQLDPERLQKQLKANKKKLAEQAAANKHLEQAVNQSKNDFYELSKRLAELKEEVDGQDEDDEKAGQPESSPLKTVSAA